MTKTPSARTTLAGAAARSLDQPLGRSAVAAVVSPDLLRSNEERI
jgi:hypothetical protein